MQHTWLPEICCFVDWFVFKSWCMWTLELIRAKQSACLTNPKILPRASSHGSPKSLEVNLANPNHWERGSCWDLSLHIGSQVPSPTLMPPWQHFLEVRLGTWPNPQHKFSECFCIEELESDFNEYEPYFNGFLEAPKLRFWLHVGNWDLGPRVKRP
jgi:hypothetical protein